MVNYLKNSYGDIICYIEWWMIDFEGRVSERGDYIQVYDYYICPKYRHNKDILKKLIRKILDAAGDQCHTVTWVRHKYNERMSVYPIDKFKEMVNYGEQKKRTNTAKCS